MWKSSFASFSAKSSAAAWRDAHTVAETPRHTWITTTQPPAVPCASPVRTFGCSKLHSVRSSRRRDPPGLFYVRAVIRHAGPHTSAWSLALLASAASLCVSGWQTAFRACAASHSVLALQAEQQFPCRPVDARGRFRALETRGACFSVRRSCHILRRARQAYTAPCHNSRSGGRAALPHSSRPPPQAREPG